MKDDFRLNRGDKLGDWFGHTQIGHDFVFELECQRIVEIWRVLRRQCKRADARTKLIEPQGQPCALKAGVAGHKNAAVAPKMRIDVQSDTRRPRVCAGFCAASSGSKTLATLFARADNMCVLANAAARRVKRAPAAYKLRRAPDQAASISSASSTTRTLRPRRSSKMATRSLSFIPS